MPKLFKRMRVLVACERSNTVRDAFLARGHDAYSCDLEIAAFPNPNWRRHIRGDAVSLLGDGWDLLIAHPPCTYLSNAGARFLYPKGKLNPRRLKVGMKAKELFMAFLNADIPKICVENPIPSSVFGIPKCDQIIQPYFFGDPVQKKTCLWLKNLPCLVPTNMCNIAESTKIAGNWFNKGGKDRQQNRAKTFQGIADAMAAQWG